MKLETLALAANAQVNRPELLQRKSIDVTGITCDSRTVRIGDLFAALPGAKSNGVEFAREATQQGAVAVLCQSPILLDENIPQLICPEPRAGLAKLARAFYNHADLRLRMGAVTGTNGKSTTAYLVRHLLTFCGRKCGMLGTIEYDVGSQIIEAPLTTPESLDLHRYIRTMVDAGCDSAFMEASSHALCQHRIDGIHFETAVFTNLTQDHLDFHRTMEEYREAKSILFRELLPDATAIINMDDMNGPFFAKNTRARVLGFNTRMSGAPRRMSVFKYPMSAMITRMTTQGTIFNLESPWGRCEINMKLAGVHNVQNALGALGAAVSMGADFNKCVQALESFDGVPGRLQSVALDPKTEAGRAQSFRVFVDYAHTEDALRSVMNALRELKPSRIISVFGCGGDRDRTKRPKMGRAVEEMADLGVITSDNPRTEDPDGIIAEICSGIHNQSKFIVEPDRAKAISMAIKEARGGDVVLIAGKGHENYQIHGTKKYPFSDLQHALRSLNVRFSAQPETVCVCVD